MKNELGLKDGKPIVGSIWQYPREAGGADRNFRIEVPSDGSSYETLSMQDGDRWIGGHGWSTARIIKEWKLVSLPGGGVPEPRLKKNALGLKNGIPIIGSVWEWNHKTGDKWRVLGPPDVNKNVPVVHIGHGGRSVAGLAAFAAATPDALISLPAGDGEPVWTPLDRAMPRWEEQARASEKLNNHADAKKFRVQAAALVETDARIVAEESALKEKRYIAKAQLKRLTPGDRACYAMRGLKEFKLHTEAADYLYWE